MIRSASIEDCSRIAQVERLGFTPEEAASEEQIRERLAVFPSHFLLLEEEGEIRGYIAGAVTHLEAIIDELYEDVSLHDEDAAYQSVFSLVVLPQYQNRGYGKRLMQELICRCMEQSRRGIILTCREELIPYYESFGFERQGISQSVHGGIRWYDMKLNFVK